MGYFRQFETFDPINGDVPSYPFDHLPTIAQRARKLLSRSREQIISAANTVDWVIEDYFRTVKEEYIQRLVKHGGREPGYLPEEERTETGIRNLIENGLPAEADDSLTLPTTENTSEVTALKEAIGNYVLDEADFPSGKEYEYFAVLALSLVADSLEWMRYKRDEAITNLTTDLHQEVMRKLDAIATSSQSLVKELGLEQVIESIRGIDFPDERGTNLRLAGGCALEAMDAVCYAEHLMWMDLVAAGFQSGFSRIKEESKLTTEKEVEEKMKQRTSLDASRAASKRHEKSTELKSIAVTLYLTKTWPSVRQASKNIYPQLVERGHKIGFVFSPDRGEQTVYEWLLEARKGVRKQADV